MTQERQKDAEYSGEEITTLTLEEWLQNVALMSDSDQVETDTSKVTLMTIHSSKGLEYEQIYVVGVEQEQFPGTAFFVSENDIEEERRLFYVAVTRAKKNAVITYCKSRYANGKPIDCSPSQFIDEIDDEYLDGYDKRDKQTMANSGQMGGLGATHRPVQGSQSGWSSRPTYPQGQRPMTQPRQTVQPRPTVVEDRFRRMGVRRATEEAVEAAATALPASSYRIGQKVCHAKFGEGVVTGVEAMATDVKITVRFANPEAGQKSLLSKFAKLKIIE